MAEYTVKIAGRDYCWRARVEKNSLAELSLAENASTDLWLTRGLVDIQVNGYQGVLLTRADNSVDDLADCRCYRAGGAEARALYPHGGKLSLR